MAVTGATQISSLNDMIAAELVSTTIYETARAALVAAPLVAYDEMMGSNVKNYTRYSKVTAAALTEMTDATATEITDSVVTTTLAEVGIGANVGDTVAVASSVGDQIMLIASELGRAFADKVEIDILAKASSLTDAVGSTGAALTEDVWLQGIYECEANDIGGRPLACVLYPRQVHNLRAAIAGTTENTSAVYGRPDMLSPLAPAQPSGFVFRYMNVDIFQSTNVPTGNSATDSLGMFLTYGPGSPIMLTVGVLPGEGPWFARRRLQRDESLRSTEIWVTGFYGLCVPAPERGCGIFTIR